MWATYWESWELNPGLLGEQKVLLVTGAIFLDPEEKLKEQNETSSGLLIVYFI